MSLAASAGRGPGAVWSPTHVQVTVLQARGLRAKGPGGTSDAYAVIQVGKEKYATSVSERSLGAPVWREEATFELPPLLSAGAAPAAAATLQLTVLHRALLGLDKFLGRAEVDLRELHRDQGRRKTQWYTLKSKPGKKDKERGEIEVDIQFMRNNMTASMFDLSMKDKSRNPFGKLKDKIKGKPKDNASDTASAIVPSVTPSADSDDESPLKDKKKKSKIKTLFSKSNLQKTPLSQSMSVLPTSKSDKVLLRPGDFQSRWEDDDNEDESSSASDVMSHKRTESADPKQLNQSNFSLPKREGPSFFGGLRSKNDVLSRSNVCINGNHVYLEQPETKGETKESTPSSSPSPQGFRKKHLFSSTENLATRSWKEPGDGGAVSSDRRWSESSTKDSLKSMSLPSYQPQVSGDIRENAAPASLEAAKETKESKKQENKKSSLLSLVTGKKDTAKGSEGGSPSATPGKETEGTSMEVKPREDQPGPDEDLGKRSEKDTVAVVFGQGRSLNPFEEVQVTEPEPDRQLTFEPTPPVGSTRAPQTKAVKPRLDVSPEAPATARLPSSPDSTLFFSALLSSSGQTPVPSKLGHCAETPSSESPSVFSFSSPIVAPISTSTPVENWPPTDQGQASPEEPSLLHKAELLRESLTQDPKTVSCASGSRFQQLPTPAWKGMEDYPMGKTSEIGLESTVGHDSERSLLKQPEREEVQRAPHSEQDYAPSSQETQEVTLAPSFRSGQIESPAWRPLMGEHTGSEHPFGSFGENRVKGGSMTSAIKEAAPPLQSGESAPTLGSVMQRHKENVDESQKKIKKRVSFSEEIFMEEELEESTGLVEEHRDNPQEVTHKGATSGNLSDGEPAGCFHAEVTETEAVSAPGPVKHGVPASMADPLHFPSSKECVSEGPVSEASSGKDIPLLKIERDDTPMAQNQSKASDHEGLLSDPLSGLHSIPGINSPVMADLGLTLPAIPEVASDDERVDQGEDDRETAQVAALQVGPSSVSMSHAHPEMEKGPRGEADGWAAPVESLPDLGSKAPEVSVMASSEPTTASGIHKPELGKSSRLDKQLPGPGCGKKEKLMGNGRPSQPPDTALDSPVPSPSFSETFPITHSFPSHPHADTHHTSTAESQKKATAEGSADKVENSGKRKPLLQAWVSPSETQPVSAQPSAGTGSAKHRLHPVKPMNTTATKIANSSLGTATIISENLINETMMKKYNPSDPAFAYAQLTHDELIQLVLKQKETISKKEFQVRELEDYIDNLLVRVMEETPNILRVPAQVGKKAGKM
ncbi:rab11 family-interacting protein 1 isoform X1 [Canis lupus baileyi]|uniref:Rab11 family-interacting protein 1 n=1 Tax=Canis lupus familiaris TaxID=9615 RepID=A0A8P0N8Q2_CANLF|nr:rab11 family-interacting protein 1 isoform X1 [Canis lupus familiaris]|eukprot:XP_539967.2 rab11 family-interacting protein 1 isoform X1 [Canis lupus familiaris]